MTKVDDGQLWRKGDAGPVWGIVDLGGARGTQRTLTLARWVSGRDGLSQETLELDRAHLEAGDSGWRLATNQERADTQEEWDRLTQTALREEGYPVPHGIRAVPIVPEELLTTPVPPPRVVAKDPEVQKVVQALVDENPEAFAAAGRAAGKLSALAAITGERPSQDEMLQALRDEGAVSEGEGELVRDALFISRNPTAEEQAALGADPASLAAGLRAMADEAGDVAPVTQHGEPQPDAVPRQAPVERYDWAMMEAIAPGADELPMDEQDRAWFLGHLEQYSSYTRRAAEQLLDEHPRLARNADGVAFLTDEAMARGERMAADERHKRAEMIRRPADARQTGRDLMELFGLLRDRTGAVMELLQRASGYLDEQNGPRFTAWRCDECGHLVLDAQLSDVAWDDERVRADERLRIRRDFTEADPVVNCGAHPEWAPMRHVVCRVTADDPERLDNDTATGR